MVDKWLVSVCSLHDTLIIISLIQSLLDCTLILDKVYTRPDRNEVGVVPLVLTRRVRGESVPRIRHLSTAAGAIKISCGGVHDTAGNDEDNVHVHEADNLMIFNLFILCTVSLL